MHMLSFRAPHKTMKQNIVKPEGLLTFIECLLKMHNRCIFYLFVFCLVYTCASIFLFFMLRNTCISSLCNIKKSIFLNKQVLTSYMLIRAFDKSILNLFAKSRKPCFLFSGKRCVCLHRMCSLVRTV